MTPTVDVLTGIAMAFVIVVGGDEALGGALEVGVLVTFILSVQRFFEPVRLLSMQYTVMQRAMAAGHRIFEVLDVPVTIADSPARWTLRREPDRRSARTRHLRLRPCRPILHDVSLDIAAARGGRPGRPHRLGQDHHRRPGPPLLRRRRGPGAGRRPRRARRDPGLARPRGRHGAAGAVPVHRHHRGEHPLQHRGASQDEVVARRQGGRAHDFIMRLPAGLRHASSASAAATSRSASASWSPSPAPWSPTPRS